MKPPYLTPTELRVSDTLRGRIYRWQEANMDRHSPGGVPDALYLLITDCARALSGEDVDAKVIHIPKVGESAALPSSATEAPTCENHGTMVPDNESGASWHCAVCETTFPSSAMQPTEHQAFVAVMNALDVHMPPDGWKLLNELRDIAETVGYPWRAASPSTATPERKSDAS